MKIVEKYLLTFLLYLFPTQLAYHFWPNWSFVYGFRIDLLAPALYLTELIVIYLILTNIKFIKPILKYLLIIILFAIVNIHYSISIYESLYKWFKFLEFIGFSYYISKQTIFKSKPIFKILFNSTVFISIIGIFQFIKGGTIGGLLYFLGERSFSTSTPGIALFNLGGVQHLRAYSTFSHPNSLAGYLGVILIIIILNKYLRNSPLKYFGIVLITLCVILSYSQTVFISLSTVLVIYLFKPKAENRNKTTLIVFILSVFSSLVFPVISVLLSENLTIVGDSIIQRIDLSYIAGLIISDNLLFGTGLGTFILNIPKYNGILTFSWILQPVHNIFLLIVTEIGLLGLILCCLGIYKIYRTQIFKNSKYLIFIFIILTGMLDHYWLTLQQNQLLLSLLIGLVLRYDRHINYEK